MDITKKESPNHYDLKGTPNVLVLHTTLGSLQATTSHFLIPNNVSAHYAIDRNGDIVQYVELNQGAWHAGRRHKPSLRAKAVLPKEIWGSLKNPNRYTIGLEFVSGYDIDRDGVLERWEQLYTPKQMKTGARLVLDKIEPELNVTYDPAHILTHKDIASYKPDLEIQRSMFLAVLDTERQGATPIPTPEPEPTIILQKGEKATIHVLDGKARVDKLIV